MKDVAGDISAVVKTTLPRLEAIGEAGSLRTRGPGTWSRKQILGHLIDSALNNHQRFVRAQQGSELVFPNYDQPLWVGAGGYQERSWTDLVALWAHLNSHLSHVVARIPPDRRATPCRIGGSEPMTLEFIVRDYVVHMRHHLDQILDPEPAAGKAPPPFA